MKRIGLLVTGIALLAAAFLVLTASNPAQAQVPDNTTPGSGYAWCHEGDADDMWNIMQDYMGGAWGGHMGGGYLGGVNLGRVAKLLGITSNELTAQLRDGASLAQVAQGYGVTEEQLVNTLVEPYQARLEVQVRYGYLTQEEADELLSLARESAQTTINRTNVLPKGYNAPNGTQGQGPNTPSRGGVGYGPGGMMGGYGGGTTGGYGLGGMMGGYGGGTTGGFGGMMGRGF